MEEFDFGFGPSSTDPIPDRPRQVPSGQPFDTIFDFGIDAQEDDEEETPRNLRERVMGKMSSFFESLREKYAEQQAKSPLETGLGSALGVANPLLSDVGRARGVAEGVVDAPAGIAAGIGDLVGAEDFAESARNFEFTSPLDDMLPEADPTGRMVGRLAGELGMTFGGGAGVGAGLRALGASGRLGKAGQVAGKLGESKSLLADAARFAPIDAVFGLGEDTSGAQALADFTGIGDEALRQNPLLRAAAEVGLGGVAGATLTGAARGFKHLRGPKDPPGSLHFNLAEPRTVVRGQQALSREFASARTGQPIRLRVFKGTGPETAELTTARKGETFFAERPELSEGFARHGDPDNHAGPIFEVELDMRNPLVLDERNVDEVVQMLKRFKGKDDFTLEDIIGIDDIQVQENIEFLVDEMLDVFKLPVSMGEGIEHAILRAIASGERTIEGMTKALRKVDDMPPSVADEVAKEAVEELSASVRGPHNLLNQPDEVIRGQILGVGVSGGHDEATTRLLMYVARREGHDGIISNLGDRIISRRTGAEVVVFPDNNPNIIASQRRHLNAFDAEEAFRQRVSRGEAPPIGRPTLEDRIGSIRGLEPSDAPDLDRIDELTREILQARRRLANRADEGAVDAGAGTFREMQRFLAERAEILEDLLNRPGVDPTEMAEGLVRNGFIEPELMGAITRTGAGALVGGAAGAAASDDGEHTITGAIVGAAAGAVGPRLARVLRQGRIDQAEEAVSALARREADEIDRLVREGDLGPNDYGGVRAATERSTPKAVDVDREIRRIMERLNLDVRGQIRTGTLVKNLVEEGRIDARRVTNAETQRLAREVGFDPDMMRKPVGRLGRVEQVALLNQLQAASRGLTRMDALLSRSQGRVSQKQWDDILRVRNSVEEHIDDLASRLLREGSEAGRNLQAQKMRALMNASFDPKHASVWVLRAKRLAKDKFRAEDVAEIERLLREGDKQGMREFMEIMETRGMNWGEKLATFIKAGLLSAPKTDMVNIGSSLSHWALRMSTDPASAVADRFLSSVLKTGQRTKSAALADPAVLPASLIRGHRKGMEEAGRMWRTGEGQVGLQKYDYTGMRTGNYFLDAWLKWGFRRLGAEDMWQRGLGFQTALQERARVMALNSGLKPGTPQFRRKMTDIMADPPDDLVIHAAADAEVFTFMNVNRLGSGVVSLKKAMRESGGFGALAAELGAPFVNTLINVADSVLRLSPLAPLRHGTDIIKFVNMARRARAGKSVNADELARLQRVTAEAIGAATTTGAALMTAGFMLRREGLMTTDWPSGEEGNVFFQSDLQPNAVKVGNSTVSIQNISPAGNIIALGAAFADHVESNDIENVGQGIQNAVPLLTGTFASYGKQLTELTFLSQVNSALDAIANPERSGKFIENLGRMTVPTIFRQTANIVDPVMRQTDGFFDAIQASTPFSQMMDPQVDHFGRDRERQPQGPERLINPFQRKPINQEPMIQELTRIGVGIPRLQTPSRRGLEGEERVRAERFYGQALEMNLDDLMRSHRWQSANDEERADMARQTIRNVRRAVTQALDERGAFPQEDKDARVPQLFQRVGGGGDNSSGQSFDFEF